MSIRSSLKTLEKKERLSLHMPGHKGLRLKYDTTELDLTDNILNPQGSILELERAIAHIYDSRHAYLGTNGATSLLLSSLLYAGRGARVVLPRVAHQSIYKGLIDFGQEPVYLTGRIDSLGIARPVSSVKYLENIDKGDCFVFYGPTYEGYIEDYKVLKPFLKERLTLNDGAHGSHLYYIKKDINNWMDLTVHSFHKTLGAMNQGGVLLSNLEEEIREYAGFFQSSSPSYPIMLSIEDSIREMMTMKIEDKLGEMKRLRQEIDSIKGFKTVANDDPLKLLLITDSEANMTEIASFLKENKGIFFEIEDERYLLGILSFYDGRSGYEWLAKSLKQASKRFGLKDSFKEIEDEGEVMMPEMKLLPGEAFGAPRELVPLRQSLGRVSGILYSQYPPGAPILVPGEVIDERVVETILNNKRSYTGCKELKDERIFVIR